jgi:hypothetical protein
VHLLQLIEQLTNQDIPIPGGFDLTLIDSSVLIQKTGATNLVFQLATTLEQIGTIAFEARRVGTAGASRPASTSRARASPRCRPLGAQAVRGFLPTRSSCTWWRPRSTTPTSSSPGLPPSRRRGSRPRGSPCRPAA